jgi:ABC-type multidrug transport system ATPase subunit
MSDYLTQDISYLFLDQLTRRLDTENRDEFRRRLSDLWASIFGAVSEM